jgi:methionyl-tRNA formyltransferase
VREWLPRMTLVFFGTPDFAVPSLRRLCGDEAFRVSLVVSQPDRPVGRRQLPTPPPVARFARERGLPLLQPGKLRDDAELLARLQREAPDFLVVVAYGKLLPPEILEIPAIACVNVHASLLPKYRGASPVAAALLAGESETGVSIMKMTEGLDEGPVYAVRHMPIGDSDDAAILSEKLAREGADLLTETLPRIAAGSLAARPQEGEPSWCRTIRKEDGKIDWDRPAQEIARRLRAFTPWPGIFTFLGGERVRILKAAAAQLPSDQANGGGAGDASSGSLLRQTDGGFLIACGEGTALAPELLQREGRKPLTAEEFIRGLPSDVLFFRR